MEYEIKKGDKFLCKKDYVMDDDKVAYTAGKTYLSEREGHITDNYLDTLHRMSREDEFFDYFSLVTEDDSEIIVKYEVCRGYKSPHHNNFEKIMHSGGLFNTKEEAIKYLKDSQRSSNDYVSYFILEVYA